MAGVAVKLGRGEATLCFSRFNDAPVVNASEKLEQFAICRSESDKKPSEERASGRFFQWVSDRQRRLEKQHQYE